MKKVVKISAIAALALGLVACNNDTAGVSSITFSGAYPTGSAGNTVTKDGFKWTVNGTGNSVRIDCPTNYYVPNVVVSNPPADGGDVTIINKTSNAIQGIGVLFDTAVSTPAGTVVTATTLAPAVGEDITNQSLLPGGIDMICVPASAVDSFTAG